MLSVSRNMRACASVLHATLDTLSTDTRSDDHSDKADEAPAACSVRFDPVVRDQKDKPSSWCHACVLDASDGLWTVASTLEGDDWVLMAMRGTLSKHTSLLERMCLYRMELPRELFSGPHAQKLKCQLMPKLRADSLTTAERRDKIKEACSRLDKWFATQSKELSFEDVFTPDVVLLRHVTDFKTGQRSTVCFGKDTFEEQDRRLFGDRTKHVLADVVIPQHYMTFVQSYEVTKGADGRQWRQSSLRIRVLDPSQDYKLKLGLIFYSERDCLPQRMLKQSGTVNSSTCPPARVEPAAAPAAAGQAPAPQAAVPDTARASARKAPDGPMQPAPSKRIKRRASAEAIRT